MKFLLPVLLLALISCSSPSRNRQHEVVEDYATDVHMHIHANIPDEDMQFDGNRAILAFESVGLKRALVLSNSYTILTTKESARFKNEFVAEAVKKHPDRLAGACAINPLRDWADEEIKNCHREGLKVIKLHTLASGMDLTRPEDQVILRHVLAKARELKMSVIVHGSFQNSFETKCLLKTLSEYPEVRVILAHGLGKDYELLTQFTHPNFLVELSVIPIWAKNPAEKAKIVSTVRRVGLAKFIFGSDWPVYHPAENMKALRDLPFKQEELDAIIYENARTLNDLF